MIGVALVLSFALPVFAADKPKVTDPLSAKIEIVKRLNEAEKEIDKIGERVDNIKNPYALTFRILSVIVGVVALLLGLGGIYAGFLLHRQGSDFKDRMDKNVEQHDKEMKEFREEAQAEIDDRSKRIKKYEKLHSKLILEGAKKLDDLIGMYKEKLKTESGEMKKEIEKDIIELQKERATVEARNVGEGVLAHYARVNFTKCPNCGGVFPRRAFVPTSGTLLTGIRHTCPSCKNEVILPPQAARIR